MLHTLSDSVKIQKDQLFQKGLGIKDLFQMYSSFFSSFIFSSTSMLTLSQSLKVRSMFAQNSSSEVNHLPAVSPSAQPLI